ncbi:tRNA glutamyl-Q(34) synthetase GluQRS [Paraferrimonas sp. SM1919]|uniref:tRNA glutamyl-Q(34) synthetase GluQRS n=1 Tax=Paraferrimonas sp. SM1919 TaxID=2662263 RepID=UPI0013D78137|nr:tRNA glutamyl-Q(34) synthetase GluQRS [Paraferrimonas sp. SM1919]
MTQKYIGRFAPSPSGPLHFGSVVAALGSYLRAKSLNGKWLLRIEDIDPPREPEGAAEQIIRELDRLGLHWDGEVYYQSQASERYLATLDSLLQKNLAYRCNCSRKRINALGGIYDGHCRNMQLNDDNKAIRLVNPGSDGRFYDQLLGVQQVDPQKASEDFLIHRRDNLFAYQLAVVCDDIHQGITEIVRGSDILAVTPWQMALYQQLGQNIPQYLHLPLAVMADGRKLSKQNHAKATYHLDASEIIANALAFLGQPLPVEMEKAPTQEQLNYALAHFSIKNIPTSNQLHHVN